MVTNAVEFPSHVEDLDRASPCGVLENLAHVRLRLTVPKIAVDVAPEVIQHPDDRRLDFETAILWHPESHLAIAYPRKLTDEGMA